MKLKVSTMIVALLSVFGSMKGLAEARVINGVEVPKGMFSEVVVVKSDGAACTATIVGQRALIAAAHCFRAGSTVEFEVGGTTYTGKGFRHPEYPQKDVDVSLVVVDQAINGVAPATIGSTVAVGDRVFLLGFGCTTAGGGGGNDKVLRMGESVVTSVGDTDFITRKPSGGVLCFGDSGGPTLAKEAGKFRVVGVNSKGNIQDTNYSTYLALPRIQRFLMDTAKQEGIDICGVTKSCEGVLPGVPHFKKQAYAFSILEGATYEQSLTSLLDTPLKGLTWHLEPGHPSTISIKNDVLIIEGRIETRKAVMTYDVTLTVKGPGGADATLIHVVVTGPDAEAPKCSLTATPSFVRLGESLILSLTTTGEVSGAQLEGAAFPASGGSKKITPVESGVFVAQAGVKGPAGAGTCSVRYGVK